MNICCAVSGLRYANALEYFVEEGTDEDWLKIWTDLRLTWWLEQGIKQENLEILNVPKEDLSHYSKATVDIMYKFPHGLEELEGIANRTDFDLGSHTKEQSNFNITAKITKNTSSNSKLAIQNIEALKHKGV
jgi:glycyl-tRNA synthetase